MLYSLLVIAVGSSNKVVIGGVHLVPHTANLRRHVIYVFLGCDARLICLQLDFLTVLVGTRAEENIVPAKSLVPCDCVSHDDLIGVAEMGLRGRISNGGG